MTRSTNNNFSASTFLAGIVAALFALGIFYKTIPLPDFAANGLTCVAGWTPLGTAWWSASVVAGLIAFFFIALFFALFRSALLVLIAKHRQSLAEKSQKKSAPQTDPTTDKLLKLYK